MKTYLTPGVALLSAAFLFGCSKPEEKPATPPPPASQPPAEQPSSPPPAASESRTVENPQTIYGKAIKRAEDVSKLVAQRAVETADALSERTAAAMERLKTVTREEVVPWLEEQKVAWNNRANEISEAARQKGVEAEPAVRAAMERLRQAREAAERKAQELKSAAEAEIPRLRKELQDAWRRVSEEEQKAAQTVANTA